VTQFDRADLLLFEEQDLRLVISSGPHNGERTQQETFLLDRLSSIDVNDSIRRAVSLFRPQLRAGNPPLEVELASELPPVEGRLEHLQDVWINLLLNARDALGEQHREPFG
jgi:signal transduction histidine kinase